MRREIVLIVSTKPSLSLPTAKPLDCTTLATVEGLDGALDPEAYSGICLPELCRLIAGISSLFSCEVDLLLRRRPSKFLFWCFVNLVIGTLLVTLNFAVWNFNCWMFFVWFDFVCFWILYVLFSGCLSNTLSQNNGLLIWTYEIVMRVVIVVKELKFWITIGSTSSKIHCLCDGSFVFGFCMCYLLVACWIP